MPKQVVEAAIEAALEALDQPLTRPEIAERVSHALGVQMQAIQGGGWGSRRKVAAVPVGELIFPVVDLLNLAAARGVVCYGPSAIMSRLSSGPTHGSHTGRICPCEQAEEMLLRKYLWAYGPATAKDFALWVGMMISDADVIWARQQADIAPVEVEGRAGAVLREDLDELAQAGFERPQVRLLPYFDSFLLGHRQRQHLMAVEHQPKVYRAQGWIAPVFLVDGRAAGVWEYAREGTACE